MWLKSIILVQWKSILAWNCLRIPILKSSNRTNNCNHNLYLNLSLNQSCICNKSYLSNLQNHLFQVTQKRPTQKILRWAFTNRLSFSKTLNQLNPEDQPTNLEGKWTLFLLMLPPWKYLKIKWFGSEFTIFQKVLDQI